MTNSISDKIFNELGAVIYGETKTELYDNIAGGQLKAYADLRQFLIDNAVRVAKDYKLLINTRNSIVE